MSRTNKADHPRERIATVPLPPQPAGIDPLIVLLRTDGKYIVFDPRRALGAKTASTHNSYQEACDAAVRKGV